MYDPIEQICPNELNKEPIKWIYDAFGDCIFTQLDLVAFIFGLMSLALFTVAMFPQLYKTYQLKSISGLSPSFLLIWLLGDAANLMGALWTSQLPIIVWTGIYFLFVDVLIFTQWAYYGLIRPRMGRGQAVEVENDSDDGESLVDDRKTISNSFESSVAGTKNHLGIGNVAVISSITLLSLMLQTVEAKQEEVDSKVAAGIAFAWMSGLLYFTSRIPQIVTNFKLKTVEGISASLFIITISANTLYGLSILLRIAEAGKVEDKFYYSTLPYVLGSMGTLIFDAIIIYQIYRWGKSATSYEEIVDIQDV